MLPGPPPRPGSAAAWLCCILLTAASHARSLLPFSSQGKVQKAADLLRRAREKVASPKGAVALGELYHVEALLYLKLGRPKKARQCVDDGLAAAPTHAPLYRVLGAMQDVSGDVEGARASFAEGLRLSPGYAQLYHASARLEGKLLNW